VNYIGSYKYYASYVTLIAKAAYYSNLTNSTAFFSNIDYTNAFNQLNSIKNTIVHDYKGWNYCPAALGLYTKEINLWGNTSQASVYYSTFIDFLLETNKQVTTI
jgi:hypothetical protein